MFSISRRKSSGRFSGPVWKVTIQEPQFSLWWLLSLPLKETWPYHLKRRTNTLGKVGGNLDRWCVLGSTLTCVLWQPREKSDWKEQLWLTVFKHACHPGTLYFLRKGGTSCANYQVDYAGRPCGVVPDSIPRWGDCSSAEETRAPSGP